MEIILELNRRLRQGLSRLALLFDLYSNFVHFPILRSGDRCERTQRRLADWNRQSFTFPVRSDRDALLAWVRDCAKKICDHFL